VACRVAVLADPAVQRSPADGAKPFDLPSQQPSNVHLVADRRALKALGLALPHFVLCCAPTWGSRTTSDQQRRAGTEYASHEDGREMKKA